MQECNFIQEQLLHIFNALGIATQKNTHKRFFKNADFEIWIIHRTENSICQLRELNIKANLCILNKVRYDFHNETNDIK